MLEIVCEKLHQTDHKTSKDTVSLRIIKRSEEFIIEKERNTVGIYIKKEN